MFLLLDSQLDSGKKQTKKKILIFFPTPKHRNANGVSTEKMLVGWMMDESMNKQKNYCSEEIKRWFALHLRGFYPLKHTLRIIFIISLNL